MLDEMCRTCLATCGELVPIFSNDYYVRNLPDKLFHTTRIEVQKTDNLPKMMCKKCIFLVDSLYCFKDQCEMAEIKLKKRLLQDGSGNNISSSLRNNKNYNSYILGRAMDHSDAVSSSEEEYDIEYVSEEARLEVENARKRSRKAKKNCNNHSGIKVKSVEILPSEGKENIYKNLSSSTTSYKYDIPEIKEDPNITDSDDRTSFVPEESRRLNSGNSDTSHYYEPYVEISEKTDYHFMDQNHEWMQEKSVTKKSASKRRIESDNSFTQMSKVPKKVMFKDNDYGNENMQFVEVGDNQENKLSNSIPKIEDDLNTIVQINVIEDGTGKILQNYDVPVSKYPSNFTNSITTEYMKIALEDTDSTKFMEIRLKNLVRHIVLDLPEVCTICSEFFESYIDVLKHKVQTHLNVDQECFFCPICHGKFYTNCGLVKHLNDHSDVCSFICILCSGNFYTEESLRTHLHSHVNLHELKCQMCSKKFHRIQNLLNHLEQHISVKQLVCALCSDSFSSKDLLQNHIDEEHKKPQEEIKSPCTTCGVLVPEEELDEHAKTHNNYPCPYCERSFSLKTTLRDHVFTHLGVQQYSCLVCEKSFSSQEERTQHMQEHMKPQQKDDRKKFRCRVCHEILVSRAAYGQHLKEKHWNSKQTSEILRELSESSINEKMNEQLNKSCGLPTSDFISTT